MTLTGLPPDAELLVLIIGIFIMSWFLTMVLAVINHISIKTRGKELKIMRMFRMPRY